MTVRFAVVLAIGLITGCSNNASPSASIDAKGNPETDEHRASDKPRVQTKPTLHTLLYRGTNGEITAPITLDEWRDAVRSLKSFTITDTLKQRNPFTKEFVFFDVPGSGPWKCGNLLGPVWSEDDLIWFRYTGGAVTFIQFEDLQNPELVSLAHVLGAKLEHDEIGR